MTVSTVVDQFRTSVLRTARHDWGVHSVSAPCFSADQIFANALVEFSDIDVKFRDLGIEADRQLVLCLQTLAKRLNRDPLSLKASRQNFVRLYRS